jgi:hypothetical protein
MTHVLLILASLVGPVWAGSCPSVGELETSLHAHPGATLPQQVVSGGRAWTGFYMGASGRGCVYNIRVVLR